MNGAFVGVRIPAGASRVELRYLPPGFAGGVAVGLAAIASFIALLIAWPRLRTGLDEATRSSAISRLSARAGTSAVSDQVGMDAVMHPSLRTAGRLDHVVSKRGTPAVAAAALS